MLSFSKLFSKNVSLASQNFSAVRYLYSKKYLGVDYFEKYSEEVQTKESQNFEKIKKSVADSLAKKDAKIFSEDLKKLVYLAKTDDDINLLIDGIKKYKTQDSLTVFSFNFEVPLMKLLYSKEKTDKALELYLKGDNTLSTSDFSSKVELMLMNKLLLEKRYDDSIKVFKKIEASVTKEKMVKLKNIASLTGQALLEKNDFEEAKALIKRLAELKVDLTSITIVSFFLLAQQNGDNNLAFDLTNYPMKNISMKENLKIIALIKLKKYDEAFEKCQQLVNEMSGKNTKFINLSLIEALKEMVNETKKEEHQKLLDNIMANKEKFTTGLDLRGFLGIEIFPKSKTNMVKQKFDQKSDRTNQGGEQNRDRQQPRVNRFQANKRF